MQQLVKQFEGVSNWPEVIKDSFFRMFDDPDKIAEENLVLSQRYHTKRPSMT